MFCKDDVILWFKELESYRRIDIMCTLLNMCLPFELRFLGTCLEELGRRDSQELRCMELRCNNPQDLATDMIACQKGEPTDKKIRRKMALYLALIRACNNRTCVAEIFRTLEGWGERDFQSMIDPDTLQELLLVYIMAANHPVFSFEQHMKCTKIFEKIKENKLVSDPPIPPAHSQLQQQQQQPSTTPLLEPNLQHQQQKDMRHLPPSHQELMSQHALHSMHFSGQHPQLLTAGPIQGAMPINFPQAQAHLAKFITEGNLQHQITFDGIPHIIPSNIPTIPADSSSILAHPNAIWGMRAYPPPGAALEHPPQASSPMRSQQSSPSSSRATSPNRGPPNPNTMVQIQGIQTQQQSQPQQQQQTIRTVQPRMNVSIKNVRRPSAETTPPPMNQQHQQMIPNDIICSQNIKHLDEVVNSDGSGNQLQSLIRNGYRTGPHSRLKSVTTVPLQQQQQQQSPVSQHFPAIPAGSMGMNTHLTYSMQNMTLSEEGVALETGGMMSVHSNKSAASDSGSSIGSSEEISPSETPTHVQINSTNVGGGGVALRIANDTQQKLHQQTHGYNKQVNLSRLNGRSDKLIQGGVASGSSNTCSTIIYAPTTTLTNAHQTLTQQHQQQQQQVFATEMPASGAGSAGAANLMQTSLPNNNNSSSANIVVNASTNSGPNNNNMTQNTVLISSPSAGNNLIGNVVTSNSLFLQSHQQYNNAYPYHAAAQHTMGPNTRPPMIQHNPQGMAPPPQQGTIRFPGFQLPPNGDVIFPPYHPGLTFLPSGAPAPPQVALRSTNTTSVNTANVGIVPPPQLQQAPPPAPPALQSSNTGVIPNAALLASPFTTLTVSVSKPLSCYNCGSQAHSGRECTEASIDDVTRSANYKLDYSVNASSNASPTALGNVPNTGTVAPGTISGTNVGSSNSSNVEGTHHHLKQSSDGGTVSTATSTVGTTISAVASQGATSAK